MITQRYSLTELSPALDEPVSWSEFAEHSRIDSTGDKDLVEALLQSARELYEVHSRRTVAARSFRLALDKFPNGARALTLPGPPLIAVEGIEYINGDGDVTTWDSTSYQVDTWSEPGRVRPTGAQSWPSVKVNTLGAARILFRAGYPTPEEVPERVKAAIRLLTAHWYENRESVVVGQVGTELAFTWGTLVGSDHTGEML